MNQKELKELIEFLIEKDIAEFELERGDVKVKIKRGAGHGPARPALCLVPGCTRAAPGLGSSHRFGWISPRAVRLRPNPKQACTS